MCCPSLSLGNIVFVRHVTCHGIGWASEPFPLVYVCVCVCVCVCARVCVRECVCVHYLCVHCAIAPFGAQLLHYIISCLDSSPQNPDAMEHCVNGTGMWGTERGCIPYRTTQQMD